MWHALLPVLGTVARLVAWATPLVLAPQRGRARTVGDGRRARDRNSLLAKLPNLTGNRLSGAGVAAAVETGRAMLNRPSVRTSVEAAVLKLAGGTSGQFQSNEVARRNADSIALILRQRDIVPNRIGVDGLPGSGKSSLARALAEKLEMTWKSLDHENMNVPPDFTEPRTIYEHHRLFRTQDVDVFDVIVYVDEPATVCKSRILRRAKGEARQAMIIDVLDFDKLKSIGQLAFDVCDGEQISFPGSTLLMKIKPSGGFHAAANAASRLRAAGHDIEGMEKEKMLFLLAYARPQSGLAAYFVPGAYNAELLRGLLAGVRRCLAV